MAESPDRKTWLIYGSTGWIGGKIVNLLQEKGEIVHRGRSRLQNISAVAAEIGEIDPDRVINCAGITGRPNIDWCEDHKQDTLRVNILGVVGLIDTCWRRGIHLTNFGTGCIYSYDEDHALGSGTGFTEEDPPNFTGSFYSYSKEISERLAKEYSNVLTLRPRMPISDDLHPRSFIYKIARYAKVVNIPNSMTILHDLLPVAIDLAERKRVGIYNFTNPGTLSHNQILDLYTRHMDPTFTYTNFTEEEQNQILKAPRSNNELCVDKLLLEYPQIPHISDSIHQVFERMTLEG